MSNRMAEALQVLQVTPRITGARVGTILAIAMGKPLVEFPGNPFGAQSARRLSAVSIEQLIACHRERRPILLMFEDNDPRLPIIIDAVVDEQPVPRMLAPAPPSGPIEEAAFAPAAPAAGAVSRLGRIVGTEGDAVLVDFDGNELGPQPARCAVVLRNFKDPVVLMQLGGGQWVILAQLHAGIPLALDGADGADVVLKGARVQIEADVELILKSGSCSLRLDARGKAITIADQIVSSARGANKVLGGSVQLN